MADKSSGLDSTTLSADSPQQASHASILWALAALAFNAMTQPSVSAYVQTAEGTKGPLSPLRSSPVVCLLDTIIELPIAFSNFRRHPTNANHSEPYLRATTVAVTMRLAIFVMGILPQAIKLFGTRGIPGTQVLAAIFLVSSMTSMVRSLHLESASDGLAEHAKCVRISYGDHSDTLMRYISGSRVAHAGLLVWIWFDIAKRHHVSTSDAFVDFVASVYMILGPFLLLYIVWQLLRHGWLSGTPRPRGSLYNGALCAYSLTVALCEPRSTHKAKSFFPEPPTWMKPIADVNIWLSVTTMLCQVLAQGLDMLARWILSVRGDDTTTQESLPAAGPVAMNASATSTQTAGARPDGRSALQQGDNLARLDPVHVGAPSASSNNVDSHAPVRFKQPGVLNHSVSPTIERMRALPWIFGRMLVRAGAMPVEFCCGLHSDTFPVLFGEDEADVAFAVLNLVTAGMYYGMAFDGHGTVTPGWTSILG